MRTEAPSRTNGQLKNEGAAPLPPARWRETQCLVCLKWFASLESVRKLCRRYHEGHGVPVTVKRRRLHEDAPDDLPLSAFLCPACGFQRHSKHGPTRHRMASHGFRSDIVENKPTWTVRRDEHAPIELPRTKKSTVSLWGGWGRHGEAVLSAEAGKFLLAVERFCPQRPSPTEPTPTIQVQE
ncbi:hypothetical protein DQ04_11791000 [Trypanosoma grayi]|uniref:hypothetical protein n=1 Tax=Trypanosoma grayi TaxID=71804 RepID=UPI0004F4791C|nr:hypothetical protein DQ04_11791000 [Trypanosoma grayi]KEG06881.1 hypothetical protein DQ04_11791000 [Trypanosoma grayi]